MSQNSGYSDVGDAKLVTLFGLSQIKNVGDKMFETVIPISKLSPKSRKLVTNQNKGSTYTCREGSADAFFGRNTNSVATTIDIFTDWSNTLWIA